MPDDADLNDLERRLSAWRPANSGLDADALLFAAGRASAPRSHKWQAAAACLGLFALFLGNRLSVERTERQELMSKLNPAPLPAGPREPSPLALPESSYLAALRSLERDSDAWLARAMPSGASLPPGPVFHAGQREVPEP